MRFIAKYFMYTEKFNKPIAMLFLFSIFLQLLLFSRFLDNQILNDYDPSKIDAITYVQVSDTWREQGFNEAFGDLWRLPGYPSVLLLVQLVFPEAPFLALRVLQMMAVAGSVVVIYKLLSIFITSKRSFYFALLYALLPSWYFAPVLIAECLTTVMIILILKALAGISNAKINVYHLLWISLLTSFSIYLRPNNIFLIVVIVSFFLVQLIAIKFKIVSLFLIFTFLFLLPWLLFSQKQELGFIGLTTNQGVNLYIGTGMYLNYDDGILAESAIQRKVDERQNLDDRILIGPNTSRLDQNNIYKERAFEIWKDRPIKQLGYSLDKVLIAFGLKANSVLELSFGLFNLFAIFCSFLSIRVKSQRAWAVVILVTASLLATQAAIFQADRRFIVSIFLPFGLISIALVHSRFEQFFRELFRYK